ncbi:MAG TPA: hypothetical protein DGL25_05510 [Dehalococcoidia bacterium]|nr:hypothetical protein [Dehalococcoidia bacterium]|tara:strand:- start:6934 stop:7722 length:789 start_codon:yes stop_codon:yes gene_type:complete
MRYRLAAFDVDGTLVGPSGELSQTTIESLKGLASKGVLVAAATARPHELVLPTLSPLSGTMDAIIAAAGADIRHVDGVPIAQIAMPHEAAYSLAKLCDEHDWQVVAGTASGVFRRRPRDEARGPATTISSLVDIPLKETYLIAPFTGPRDPAFATLDELLRDSPLRGERALTSSGREIIAITHINAGKGAGLHRLCDSFGITPSEAVAFGDAEVDLPMLKIAGLGVAMGDAPPGLRVEADIVTGTATENGVSTAIHQIWGPV